MTGEKELNNILKTLQPVHNIGDYVFCAMKDVAGFNISDAVLLFKEKEGITVIIKKELADDLKLNYGFIAAWITLTVHSSLAAVGLTAAFSTALAEHGISCNVVAAYFHDHIFVDKKDVEKAIAVLNHLSEKANLKQQY